MNRVCPCAADVPRQSSQLCGYFGSSSASDSSVSSRVCWVSNITASSSVRVAFLLAMIVPGCGPCGMPRGCNVIEPLSIPRREGANDVPTNLECLMDRRRLMHRSGNRLEILGVESERIKITIPTEHIEWMMGHGHSRKSRAVLNEKIDILLLVDGDQFAWPVQIALRVGSAHFNLALVIQITFRNTNRANRFENQVVFLFHFVRHHPVGDAPRNDDVIFSAIMELSENCFYRSAAMKNEDDLVGAAVLVIFEFVIRLCRLRAISGHVLVEKHRNSAGVEIAASRNVRSFKMMMSQRTVGDFFQLVIFDEFDIAYPCRRSQVVNN